MVVLKGHLRHGRSHECLGHSLSGLVRLIAHDVLSRGMCFAAGWGLPGGWAAAAETWLLGGGARGAPCPRRCWCPCWVPFALLLELRVCLVFILGLLVFVAAWGLAGGWAATMAPFSWGAPGETPTSPPPPLVPLPPSVHGAS